MACSLISIFHFLLPALKTLLRTWSNYSGACLSALPPTLPFFLPVLPCPPGRLPPATCYLPHRSVLKIFGTLADENENSAVNLTWKLQCHDKYARRYPQDQGWRNEKEFARGDEMGRICRMARTSFLYPLELLVPPRLARLRVPAKWLTIAVHGGKDESQEYEPGYGVTTIIIIMPRTYFKKHHLFVLFCFFLAFCNPAGPAFLTKKNIFIPRRFPKRVMGSGSLEFGAWRLEAGGWRPGNGSCLNLSKLFCHIVFLCHVCRFVPCSGVLSAPPSFRFLRLIYRQMHWN